MNVNSYRRGDPLPLFYILSYHPSADLSGPQNDSIGRLMEVPIFHSHQDAASYSNKPSLPYLSRPAH